MQQNQSYYTMDGDSDTAGGSSGCSRPPLETLHLFELLIDMISGRSCSRACDTQLMEEVLKLLPL